MSEFDQDTLGRLLELGAGPSRSRFGLLSRLLAISTRTLAILCASGGSCRSSWRRTLDTRIRDLRCCFAVWPRGTTLLRRLVVLVGWGRRSCLFISDLGRVRRVVAVPFFNRCSTVRVDLVRRPAILVGLSSLLDLFGAQAGSAHRYIGPMEYPAHRLLVDREPLAQFVGGRSGLAARDEHLGLGGFEMSYAPRFRSIGGRGSGCGGDPASSPWLE